LLFLAYAFTIKSLDLGTHLFHFQSTGTSDLEDSLSIIGGDARTGSNLIVDNNFLDPNDHCDHCNRYQYIRSSEGWAGFAYQNNNLNLTAFKRIVLFAKGQHGGEVVNLLAIGRDIPGRGSEDDIFRGKNFAIKSTNISLTNYWKRYEINTGGIDLRNVTFPLGIIFFRNQSQAQQTFFLKGIAFDENAPEHPINISIK